MISKQNVTFILIAVLLAVIGYLILTRPEVEKPAIIKHETEIKQDTRRIDSLLLRQEELRLQLREDSLKSIDAQRGFKTRIANLEKRLVEQRAKVQELIDSVPALNAFVETQDSIIVVQAERIYSLQTEKSIQWMKFNRLILAGEEKFDLVTDVNKHYRAIDEIRKKDNRRLRKINRLLLVSVPVGFVAGVVLSK